jgi:hypothetical protein
VTTTTDSHVWTITIPVPAPWLTANIERHRYKRSTLVRQWREATVVACKAARLPKSVTPVDIAGTVYYTGRRPVRDRLNLANTIKACVDALTPHRVGTRNGKPVVHVGYGFLPDDSDRHVRSTTWELVPAKDVGRKTPVVVLTITHVAPVAAIDSHCHATREGSEIPCMRRAHDDDVHEDPDGTEWLAETLPGRKEAHR